MNKKIFAVVDSILKKKAIASVTTKKDIVDAWEDFQKSAQNWATKILNTKIKALKAAMKKDDKTFTKEQEKLEKAVEADLKEMIDDQVDELKWKSIS